MSCGHFVWSQGTPLGSGTISGWPNHCTECTNVEVIQGYFSSCQEDPLGALWQALSFLIFIHIIILKSFLHSLTIWMFVVIVQILFHSTDTHYHLIHFHHFVSVTQASLPLDPTLFSWFQWVVEHQVLSHEKSGNWSLGISVLKKSQEIYPKVMKSWKSVTKICIKPLNLKEVLQMFYWLLLTKIFTLLRSATLILQTSLTFCTIGHSKNSLLR